MFKAISAVLALLVACLACIQMRPTTLMDVSNQVSKHRAPAREGELLELYPSASGTWVAFTKPSAVGVVDSFSDEETVLVTARGAEKPQLEVKAIAFSWAFRGEALWFVDSEGELRTWLASERDGKPSTVRLGEGVTGRLTEVFGLDPSRALIELESDEADESLNWRLCVVDVRATGRPICQPAGERTPVKDAAVLTGEVVALLRTPGDRSVGDSIEFLSLSDLTSISRSMIPEPGRMTGIAELQGERAVIAIGSQQDSATPIFKKVVSGLANQVEEVAVGRDCLLAPGQEWSRVVGKWSNDGRAEYLVEATQIGLVAFSVASSGSVECRRR